MTCATSAHMASRTVQKKKTSHPAGQSYGRSSALHGLPSYMVTSGEEVLAGANCLHLLLPLTFTGGAWLRSGTRASEEQLLRQPPCMCEAGTACLCGTLAGGVIHGLQLPLNPGQGATPLAVFLGQCVRSTAFGAEIPFALLFVLLAG